MQFVGFKQVLTDLLRYINSVLWQHVVCCVWVVYCSERAWLWMCVVRRIAWDWVQNARCNGKDSNVVFGLDVRGFEAWIFNVRISLQWIHETEVVSCASTPPFTFAVSPWTGTYFTQDAMTDYRRIVLKSGAVADTSHYVTQHWFVNNNEIGRDRVRHDVTHRWCFIILQADVFWFHVTSMRFVLGRCGCYIAFCWRVSWRRKQLLDDLKEMRGDWELK